jgi:cell division protease FtsH
MVTELGMSDKVGPINYAERQGSDFLGTELMSGKWHSEDTARVIDKEIERILREAYNQAVEIIQHEREAVERLTAALLRFETINHTEITDLIAGRNADDLRPRIPEKPTERPAHVGRATAEPAAETAKGDDELGGELAGEPGLSPA